MRFRQSFLKKTTKQRRKEKPARTPATGVRRRDGGGAPWWGEGWNWVVGDADGGGDGTGNGGGW